MRIFDTILFFLPQVKRTVIISYKHDILMFHHELSNDLRLRIPGPIVPSPMDGPLSQHKKKKTYASSPPPPSPMKTAKTRATLDIPPMNTSPMAAPYIYFPLINLITMRPLTQLHCKIRATRLQKKVKFCLTW